MKLASVEVKGEELAAIFIEQKAILIRDLNKVVGENWSEDLFSILQNDQLSQLNSWFKQNEFKGIKDIHSMVIENISYAPLYRQPGKIWGVGMNYLEKAMELSGNPSEEEPVIFMKPNSSLIGPEDKINLPLHSSLVTAEAELAIIIGKTCKDIKEEDASEVVAGFTTSLDMTAKDIHARNPRFLQRSKSFDTFFSFGPSLLTVDEVQHVEKLSVETKLNGECHHQNFVSNMMFKPWWIVSFFSQIMTLHPGDVIMTGTPGSVVIREGDIVECEIPGIGELTNQVSHY